jgi:hypothetical protein
VLLTQEERRAFERLSFTSQVQITYDGNDQRVDCKDVNAEGMSIYLLENPLKLHDEIAVCFDAQNSHFPALNADAYVIRIQVIDNRFVIALEFFAIY